MKKGIEEDNIEGGYNISINALELTIIKENKWLLPIEYQPPIKRDAEHIYINTSKAELKFGWKTTTSIIDGLQRY